MKKKEKGFFGKELSLEEMRLVSGGGGEGGSTGGGGEGGSTGGGGEG